MSTDQHDNGHLGWQLAHARQLASDIGALAFGIEHALDPLSPSRLRGGGSFALSTTELEHVVDGVDELRDAADALATAVSAYLPSEDPVVLNAERIAVHAARALSNSSGDPKFVTLAASMLYSNVGRVALATAISTDPGFLAEWGSLTVGDLLARFSDADAALVRRISQEANVASDARWEQLDPETTARLAQVLRGSNV